MFIARFISSIMLLSSIVQYEAYQAWKGGYFNVEYSGLRTVHNVNDLSNAKHVMLREIGNIQVDQLVVKCDMKYWPKIPTSGLAWISRYLTL